MMVLVDPITCHRAQCGYTWTPRKANPKKCPQCMGPLWKSPNPKRATISKRVEAIKFNPTEIPVPDDEDYEGSSSVVERPSAKVPEQSGKAEGGSSVQIPASPHYIDPLAERKARVDSLLAGIL